MSKILNLEYPIGFTYTGDNKDIDIKRINGWILQCIEQLESNDGLQFYSVTSGNTMVLAYRYPLQDVRYKIIITNNYSEILI